MKVLKVKVEYWLPGITIEASGPRQPVDNGIKTEWSPIRSLILLHQKFLQFDWLRAVVFQLNLKYLHAKITNLLWVVV